MKRDINKHVQCDCPKRKRRYEHRVPLGEVRKPTQPFEMCHADLCGPFPLTTKNRYILTFDHLSKYAEAIPVQDATAESYARGYATQIVARHGSGSIFVTDQGRNFVNLHQ
jgi:hypothetical protein